MNQYVNKRFSNQYKATIGADLYVTLSTPPLPRNWNLITRLKLDEGGHGG